MNQFVTTLREDLDGADLAGGALVIVLLYAFTGFDERALAMLAGIVIGTPIAEALLDALGAGPASAGIALGSVVAVTGGLVGADESAVVGATVVAIGCWIVLDSVYAWQVDDGQHSAREQARTSRADSLSGHVARRLVRPLRLFDPR